MEPIGPLRPAAIDEIQREENELRQALLDDLKDLDLLLQQHRLTDILSKALCSWVGHFIHLLKLDNPVNLIFGRLIDQVFQLLRNPFGAFWPFDEQVFLGNDEQCYSKKALAVHLSCCEDEYLQRSPIAPQDPAPFFLVGPHRIAYAVQNWLILKGIALPESEVDRLYGQLESQGRLVAIPMGRPAVRPGGQEDLFERRRQRLLARQQQRPQVEAIVQQQNLIQNDPEAAEVIQQLAALQREVDENFRKAGARIAGFFQQIHERQAQQAEQALALQNNVGLLAEDQRQIADRVQRLQEDMQNAGFEGRQAGFNVAQFQRQENMERELALFQEALQLAMVQGDVNNEEAQRMRQQIVTRFDGYMQRLVQMQGGAREQLQFIQNEIVDIYVVNLEEQIQRIDARNIELDEGGFYLAEGIKETKNHQAMMAISNNNLDKSIKKIEQNRWKAIGMAILKLGAHWSGSKALNCLVKGLSVMPSAKYGTMISYNTKL